MSSENIELDDASIAGVAGNDAPEVEVIDLMDTDSEDDTPLPRYGRLLRSSTRSLRKPAPAAVAAGRRPLAQAAAAASTKRRSVSISTSEKSDDASATSRFSENESSVNDKVHAKKETKKRTLPTRAARSANKSTTTPRKKGRVSVAEARRPNTQVMYKGSASKTKKNHKKIGNTVQGCAAPFDQNPEPLKIVVDIGQDFYIRKFVTKDQLWVYKIKPNDECPLPRKYDGRYNLLCSKFQKRDLKGGGRFHDKDDTGNINFKAFYIRNDVDVPNLLSRIADFEGLLYEVGPEKVSSRLELLVSPSAKSPCGKIDSLIWRVHKDKFEVIEDNGHEGGGYISRDLLLELVGGSRRECAKLATVIQVRLFSPTTFGIAKGTLVAKHGISGIEIPTSMIKVKNSRADDPLHDDVVVVVTNIFPSKICHSIGRLLDPNRDDPTETGIEEIKPISKALRDVLKARGVRADTLDRYECDLNDNIHNLGHASLVGVPDPTHSIPQDHLFIPGFKNPNMPAPDKVLITRSPYTEGSDVMVLKLITDESQLEDLSDAFEILSEMPFGTVFFPLGIPSLPSRINSSDLDGDKFMVIWDPEIVREAEAYTTSLGERYVSRVPSPKGMQVVNHRHTEKGIEVRCEHDGKSVWQSISAVDEKFAVGKYIFEKGLAECGTGAKLWFEIVQDSLVMNRAKDINRLVQSFSGLYKNAVNNPNLGPDSEQAILWGRAWKEANELEKHAGRIELPRQYYSIIVKKSDRFKPFVLPADKELGLKEIVAKQKPLFEVDDRVYAPYEGSWYPGFVTGHTKIGFTECGPVREYSIKFDDGDMKDAVPEEFVFSEKDYLLQGLFDAKSRFGVKIRKGKNTEDKWASIVGWYEVVIGRKKLTFSSLYEAMKAYDEEHRHKTDRRGRQMKLYYPDEYLAKRQNTSDRTDENDLLGWGRHGDDEELLVEHSVDRGLSEGWGRHDDRSNEVERDGNGWGRRSSPANDNTEFPVEHSVEGSSERWGRHDDGRNDDYAVGAGRSFKDGSVSDDNGWERRSPSNDITELPEDNGWGRRSPDLNVEQGWGRHDDGHREDSFVAASDGSKDIVEEGSRHRDDKPTTIDKAVGYEGCYHGGDASLDIPVVRGLSTCANYDSSNELFSDEDVDSGADRLNCNEKDSISIKTSEDELLYELKDQERSDVNNDTEESEDGRDDDGNNNGHESAETAETDGDSNGGGLGSNDQEYVVTSNEVLE